MNLDHAIQRLDFVINNLDNELRIAAEEMALSAMGMIVNRIQQKGLPGRKYSKVKLPEYWFFDRALNAGGRRLYEQKTRKKIRDRVRERNAYQLVNSTKVKLRAAKSVDQLDEGISYEEWRRANGLQTDQVDLTFSGRMMQNLGLIGTKKVGSIWVAVIGGTNPEVKAKLIWNTQRFGPWFKPTDEEKRLLQQQFTKRMETYLQKVLL